MNYTHTWVVADERCRHYDARALLRYIIVTFYFPKDLNIFSDILLFIYTLNTNAVIRNPQPKVIDRSTTPSSQSLRKIRLIITKFGFR